MSFTPYTLLGKSLYYLLVPVLRLQGKLAKNPRVRLLLVRDNQVLLVQNWFSPQQWTLPGGGVERGESERMALQREIKEELGVTISLETPRHIDTFLITGTPTPFRVSAYVLRAAAPGVIKRDTREIIAAEWFLMDDLPPNVSAEFQQIYARYVRGIQIPE